MKRTRDRLPRKEVWRVGRSLVRRGVWRSYDTQIAAAEFSQCERLADVERDAAISSCFVYVLTDVCGHVKVGRARSVLARLRTLQCGSATPLLVASITEVRFYDATQSDFVCQEIERSVHNQLDWCRVLGEWFVCSVEECHSAMACAIEVAVKYCSVASTQWACGNGNHVPAACIGEIQGFSEGVDCHNSYGLTKRRKAQKL